MSSEPQPGNGTIAEPTPHNRSLLVITPSSAALTGTSMSSPVRVPGTFPPEWLPDSETDTCMACACPFTLITRRHHCRSCGKIFCSDCCKRKARLLYLDNKEARVCNNCHSLIEFTLAASTPRSRLSEPLERRDETQTEPTVNLSINDGPRPPSSSTTSTAPTASGSGASSTGQPPRPGTSAMLKIQGVLKSSSNHASRLSGALNDLCNISNSSSSDQHSNKHVIFSDGIRPGTDLSEPFPFPTSSATSSNESPTNASFALPSRQNRVADDVAAASDSTTQADTIKTQQTTQGSASQSEPSKRSRGSKSTRNITVCDELGYLPPIVVSKDAPISNCAYDGQAWAGENTSSNSLASLIINQFKASKKSIQSSMESRSCPLNGIVKFEEISSLVGVNNVITFLLLKSFYLKVKIVQKICCIDKSWSQQESDKTMPLAESQADLSLSEELEAEAQKHERKLEASSGPPEYWCCTSSGLDKLGQDEIVFVLDKDKSNPCIPRDIFKIYLTLHELALRRQAIENLGNLLFQDGLFGSRDTAGLLFVQPLKEHCLRNLILPESKYLIALVLQRWEVPWSKVFPMRLLLRLGHKYNVFPYPIVSCQVRDPVYYEIGHTIISILGDFRNFRYSLTHVDGLKVMLDKTSRKVIVQLHQSNYMQFSKVLDSSNNEHVLAWSACPFAESDGHLVSVQNDEGQYETVEFYKKSSDENISFKNLETGPVLGASFIVFSGALKLNQSGQPAKISIVEDGLLIQIQSCTMSALRNAIHYMDNFDIDCENAQDPLNWVEIRWQAKDA